ncbi:hypothetical protein V1289_009465 [Bradyrhizobium sp. AZCC 2289]
MEADRPTHSDQARNRRLIDVKQPRHGALRLASIEQLDCLLLLVLGQLRRPTELDTRFSRAPDANGGARLDQAALELSGARSDRPQLRKAIAAFGEGDAHLRQQTS